MPSTFTSVYWPNSYYFDSYALTALKLLRRLRRHHQSRQHALAQPLYVQRLWHGEEVGLVGRQVLLLWGAAGCEDGLWCCRWSGTGQEMRMRWAGHCCLSSADMASVPVWKRCSWWLVLEKTSWGRWLRRKAGWYVRPKSLDLALSTHFVRLHFALRTYLAPKLRQSSFWCSRSKTKYSHTYW